MPSVSFHREEGESPIVWLGRFIFNGLPHSVSTFKSPFSPLYWYDSLADIKQPTKSMFNSIFR